MTADTAAMRRPALKKHRHRGLAGIGLWVDDPRRPVSRSHQHQPGARVSMMYRGFGDAARPYFRVLETGFDSVAVTRRHVRTHLVVPMPK